MIANTTALHAMCGALPVSPEDAPGIAAAVQRLHERHARTSSDIVTETIVSDPPPMEGAEETSSVLTSSCVSYDANGSPLHDQLSRDLIEAARDARGG